MRQVFYSLLISGFQSFCVMVPAKDARLCCGFFFRSLWLTICGVFRVFFFFFTERGNVAILVFNARERRHTPRLRPKTTGKTAAILKYSWVSLSFPGFPWGRLPVLHFLMLKQKKKKKRSLETIKYRSSSCSFQSANTNWTPGVFSFQVWGALPVMPVAAFVITTDKKKRAVKGITLSVCAHVRTKHSLI